MFSINTAMDSIKDAFKMTKRGTASASNVSETPATILNGPNSLARKLFESSNNTEAWYKMVMNKGTTDEWRLSGAKLAGAGVGLSGAGRIASGGGIYKDADGNTDIIGVPFI